MDGENRVQPSGPDTERSGSSLLLRDSGTTTHRHQGRGAEGELETSVRVVATLLAPERQGEAAVGMARTLVQRFGTLRRLLVAAAHGDPAFISISPMAREKIARVGRELDRLTRDLPAAPTAASTAAVDGLVDGIDGTEPVETLHVVLLGEGRRPIGRRVVARGSRDRCHVDPQQVTRLALDEGARAIILVHNHPSGDPTPSPADVLTTRWIDVALRREHIALVDHVVVAGSRRLSMRALGMLRA